MRARRYRFRQGRRRRSDAPPAQSRAAEDGSGRRSYTASARETRAPVAASMVRSPRRATRYWESNATLINGLVVGSLLPPSGSTVMAISDVSRASAGTRTSATPRAIREEGRRGHQLRRALRPCPHLIDLAARRFGEFVKREVDAAAARHYLAVADGVVMRVRVEHVEEGRALVAERASQRRRSFREIGDLSLLLF